MKRLYSRLNDERPVRFSGAVYSSWSYRGHEIQRSWRWRLPSGGYLYSIAGPNSKAEDEPPYCWTVEQAKAWIRDAIDHEAFK
jgi:hypothetical protein